MKPRNDRALALSAFCLEIEKHRRAPEGRVRNADGFLQFYFPRHGSPPTATDRLFVHLPREVRGPILAAWQIRGLKSALRDDDLRVRSVVLDGLEAGDLDSAVFESGVSAETLIDYVPLDEWWSFWRGTSLPSSAVQKALASARALQLIDDRWFLENVAGRGGKSKGTDAVCETLTKDDVTGWIRGVHASGDASPSGLIAARGWESVLAKTSPDALLATLDAFARKVHLIPPDGVETGPTSSDEGDRAPPTLDPASLATEAAAYPAAWLDEPQIPLSVPVAVPSSTMEIDVDEIESIRTPERPPPLRKG